MSQFVAATDNKIFDAIERAPAQVKERYDNLVSDHYDREAKLAARRRQLDDIRELRSSVRIKLDSIVRDERRSGQKFGKMVTTTDKDGKEFQEFVPDPSLARWQAQFDATTEQLKEFEKSLRIPAYLPAVLTALEDLPRGYQIEADELPTLPEFDGSPEDNYLAAHAELKSLERVERTWWNLPRTAAEAAANVIAELDALEAAGHPKLDGFIRGSSTDMHGFDIVATFPKIGWPMVAVDNVGGLHLEAFNAPALFAATFRKPLQAMLLAQLKTYDFSGAVTVEEKTAKLAEIGARLWEQRKLCEAWYLQAKAVGTKYFRPDPTPAEILLGCRPFPRRR